MSCHKNAWQSHKTMAANKPFETAPKFNYFETTISNQITLTAKLRAA
jgi:hypothetical protein